jgi:hypothetical protein
MKRYLLSILIAFALFGAPGPSFAAPAVGCTMSEMSADMDDSHDTMDCCVLDCRIACSSAATLLGEIGAREIHRAVEITSIVDVLPFASIDPRVVDPPPRFHSL